MQVGAAHRIRCINERVIIEGSKGGTLAIAIAINTCCKTAVKNECDKEMPLCIMSLIRDASSMP